MKKIILIIFLLILAIILKAKTEIEIPFINEKPIIDGVISADEWSEAVR